MAATDPNRPRESADTKRTSFWREEAFNSICWASERSVITTSWVGVIIHQQLTPNLRNVPGNLAVDSQRGPDRDLRQGPKAQRDGLSHGGGGATQWHGASQRPPAEGETGGVRARPMQSGYQSTCELRSDSVVSSGSYSAKDLTPARVKFLAMTAMVSSLNAGETHPADTNFSSKSTKPNDENVSSRYVSHG